MNDQKVKSLNPKQELFCQLYASDREFFGNGVQSYIEAYQPDQSLPNWYNTARVGASQLLTNTNVLKRIDELLNLDGFNDQAVDKQLKFLVSQNTDFGSKVAAIREYNKLKSRITEKTEALVTADVTSNGQTIVDPKLSEGFAAYLLEQAKQKTE